MNIATMSNENLLSAVLLLHSGGFLHAENTLKSVIDKIKNNSPLTSMEISRIRMKLKKYENQIDDNDFYNRQETEYSKNVSKNILIKHLRSYKKKLKDFSGVPRQYQIEGAVLAIEKYGTRVLIADEMGLGKTLQALLIIYLKQEEVLPAIVVCPNSLKYNWYKEILKWNMNVTVRILDGFSFRTSYKPYKNEIVIVNYDVLADRIMNNNIYTGWGGVLCKAKPLHKLIILDESHKIKHSSAERTKAIKQLCKKMKYIIALSGTPLESKPIELFSTIKIIKPELFKTEREYAVKYCDAKLIDGKWDYNGCSDTFGLHKLLTDHVMIRRKKQDVLKELPPKQRIVLPVEIDMKEYINALDDIYSHVQKLNKKNVGKKENTALSLFIKAKQAAAVGKLPLVIDWIKDYLTTGHKLVVFGVHRFVIDSLEAAFKGTCVSLTGGVPVKMRQNVVDEFQENKNIKLIFCTMDAGKEGWTLTAASATLTLEFGRSAFAHMQAEDRVSRIGQTADSVFAYYMIARNTFDEVDAARFDKKFITSASVLNGAPPESLELLTTLLKQSTISPQYLL